MREVVLRLALRNYERARDLAAGVADRTERTLGRVRTLSGELKSALERAEKLSGATERTAAAGRASGRAPFEGPDPGLAFLGPVNRARARVESLGHLALGGADAARTVPALLRMGGPLLLGGPLVALLAPLTQKLLAYVDERVRKEVDQREQRLFAHLEEERFRADYARRLAEDPRFARAEARRALEATLAEEARRGPRIEPFSADLALGDFGL
ncbi:MAG: hypothetical protein M9894_33065 [Planctomycetes bacterium]|nr:hypothetical protein [Planctomycetota bacterium]